MHETVFFFQLFNYILTFDPMSQREASGQFGWYQGVITRLEKVAESQLIASSCPESPLLSPDLLRVLAQKIVNDMLIKD